MKTSKIKKIMQKIIIPIIMLLLFNFIVPNYSQATVGGLLVTPLVGLLSWMADGVNHLVNSSLTTKWEDLVEDKTVGLEERTIALGRLREVGGNTITLKIAEEINDQNEAYIEKTDIIGTASAALMIMVNPPISTLPTVELKEDGDIQGLDYGFPNIKITPLEIFSGKVSLLNANYFDTDYGLQYGGSKKSAVFALRDVVSSWYQSLRLIAILGLLCVLLYVGIRMVMSSSVGDKAKYKTMFTDWLVALILVFCLHYIMVLAMTMVDQITTMLAGKSTGVTTKQVNIQVKDSSDNLDIITDIDNHSVNAEFSTSLMGLMRMRVESENAGTKFTATVMYLALTFYVIYFLFIYLKRLLTLTFLTLIAPLVALTYPLDKLKDGNGQAFNYWLKEYIMNAILPIIHTVLYIILIQSANDLIIDSPLYAIAAMAFIVPAEKMVKKMFGFESDTSPALGGFAGGALAAQAISGAGKLLSKGGGKDQKGGDKIRTKDNPTDSDIVQGSGVDALAEGERHNTPPRMPNPNTPNQNTPNPPSNHNIPNNFDQQDGDNGLENNFDQQDGDNGLGNNFDQQDGDNTPINNFDQQDGDNAPINNFDQQDGDNAPINNFDQQDGDNDLGNNHNQQNGNKRQIKNSIRANAANMIRRKFNLPKGKTALTLLGRGAKTLAKAHLIAGGAAIGLAAGMVGGDMSDTIKGLTGGAVGGALLGKAVNNNRIVGSVQDTVNELKYGRKEAENIRADKEFKRNPENRAHLIEKNPDMKKKELNERLDEYTEYRRAGLTDIKHMDNLHKMREEMETNGDTPDTARKKSLELAKLSTTYDKQSVLGTDSKDSLTAKFAASKDENGKKRLTEEQAKNAADNTNNMLRKMYGIIK